MRPIDAIFIILVLNLFLKPSKQKYLFFVLPVLAFSISSLQGYVPASLSPFVWPIIAVSACLINPKLAPISLLLLLPDYNHFWEVCLMPLLWMLVNYIINSIDNRLDHDDLPSYIRGLPLRIISLGVLYFILYPFLYL